MARDKMRRQYQRKFNRKIHRLNRQIEEDRLWLGRFIFLQKNAFWYKFEDNSGGQLAVFIRGYDKKTGYYHDYRIEYAPWMHFFDSHLITDVANAFIVKHAKVWTEEDPPRIETAIDYSKTKVDVKKLMAEPWNFYAERGSMAAL